MVMLLVNKNSTLSIETSILKKKYMKIVIYDAMANLLRSMLSLPCSDFRASFLEVPENRCFRPCRGAGSTGKVGGTTLQQKSQKRKL